MSGRFGCDTRRLGLGGLGGPPGIDRTQDCTGLADTLKPLGTGGPVELPRRGGVDEEELVRHVSHHAERV